MLLESIEKAIASLEAGAFQNLSRRFVRKKIDDYSCQANGSKIGSLKTTKSQPDCLCIDNFDNKFIMIEYTTQQTGLGNKLKSDIDACLDEKKTKIPVKNIEKIIFCYSNGKIPNEAIIEQKERLLSLGLKLELISVNDMALDIEDKYPELAKEYLGINLYKSLNILSVSEFINDSNNGLSPSLDTIFSSREKEIEELKKAFLENDIIILYGKSGVGKSKLAIELLKTIEPNENKIKCIKARGFFEYEDILRTIGHTNYYLIDDADRFSDIQTIINCLKNKKIIFTIRDYELSNFLSKLDKLETSFFKYQLNPFTNEAINNVIKNNIESYSESFLTKLNEIVNGNIRLAFMIVETCKKNNSISTLYDSRDIFGKYYEKRINKLLSKERTNLILNCIGLITFVGQVDLNELNVYSDLFAFLNIEKKEFIETIKYLENEDVVSIFENVIVEMNDQCLSNYLEYYIFFYKKIIKLKDVFTKLFPKYKRNIILMINQTLNLFFNKDNLDYIKDNLKESWKTFINNKEILKELASAFSLLNLEGTLKLLNDTINENQLDEEWVINSFNVILDFETEITIKLFKKYILSKKLSIEKAEEILINNYQFHEHDYHQDYKVQDRIVTELSTNFPVFTKSLSNYCLKLLQFEYETNSMHGNKVICTSMNIGNGDESLYLLRKKCIIFLLENNNINNVFKLYFTYYPQARNIELFKKDIDAFNNKLEELEKDEIVETGIYFYSKHIFDYYKLKWDYLYARNKKLIDLLGPVFKESVDRGLSFEERNTKYEQRLIEDITTSAQLSIERIKKLVLFNNSFDSVLYQIRNYFKVCIINIDSNYIDELLQIFIDSKWLETDLDTICYFVDRYKQISNVENTFRIIKANIPNYCKPKAFERLFIRLNNSEINDSTISLFNDYLNNINDYPFTYFVPQHWIELCRNNYSQLLILCKKAFEFEKNGHGPNGLYLIFERVNKECLFDDLYREDINFIERLYLKCLEDRNNPFDENGSCFLQIIRNNINFLSDFIDIVLNNDYDLYARKRIDALWDSEDYITYGDLLFSKLISIDKKYMIEFYATIIMGSFRYEEKKPISKHRLNWFEHSLSTYCNNQQDIIYLFECIRDFDFSSKIKCLEILFEYNRDFETFKMINLEPSSISFSGSEIPYIKSQISFYEQIKEIIPSELCFINHLAYVDDVLQHKKNSIRRVLIDEKKYLNRLNW